MGTWTARVRQAPPSVASSEPWRLASLNEISAVTDMYRLSLDTSRQYAVSRLVIPALDFTLSMSAGLNFVATVADGATVVVLLGRGSMTFTPPDEAERTQVQLSAVHRHYPQSSIRSCCGSIWMAGTDPRVRDAETDSSLGVRAAARVEHFEENISRTLTLDLSDLSRDRWSLVPPGDDVVAEVHTRRFGILTYARTASQSEDISLFDRQQRRTISVYASKEQLAEHGRFTTMLKHSTTTSNRSISRATSIQGGTGLREPPR